MMHGEIIKMMSKPKTITYEMTNDHRQLLEHMMGWYWNIAKQKELITIEDYDFLYSLWNNGVTSYNKKMQERLNRIRNLYKETNVL